MKMPVYGGADMEKKRLEYYKKKLQSKREELLRSIARTEEEGRSADDDPTGFELCKRAGFVAPLWPAAAGNVSGEDQIG